MKRGNVTVSFTTDKFFATMSFLEKIKGKRGQTKTGKRKSMGKRFSQRLRVPGPIFATERRVEIKDTRLTKLEKNVIDINPFRAKRC